MLKQIQFAAFLLIIIIFLFSCGKKETDSLSNGKNIPSNEQSLQNLGAFAKLYGYVRYFYPGDEAEKINWDKFAIYGTGKVMNASNTNSLIDTLKKLFIPVAPLLKIYSKSEHVNLDPMELVPKDTAGLKSIFWQHCGVKLTEVKYNIYYSKRDVFNPNDSVFGKLKNYPKPNEYFTADIGSGVNVSLPLSLYKNESNTLPKADENLFEQFNNELNDFIIESPDSSQAVRLGNIIIAWNIFQHFYPYFDVIKADWNEALTSAFKKAAIDKTELEYINTLKSLTSKLNDGHVMIEDNLLREAIYSPPFKWDWLENNIVIIKLLAGADPQLHPGDIILEINDVPVMKAIEKEEELISAARTERKRVTEGFSAQYSSTIKVLMGIKDSDVKLKVRSGSEKDITVNIKRTILQSFNEPGSSPAIRQIKPGIQYIDLTKADMYDINNKMDSLKNAKGIIFDVRGYPNGKFDVIRHLIDNPVLSGRWNVPLTVFPDRKDVAFDTSRWSLMPMLPRLTSNIVFITDARAISQAETFMGIIEAYKIWDIIGEPTAGTNGNVNIIYLPSGYRIFWTGMKVLKHDGSQLHGIGILPTIPVSRTIKGVLAGRDEQLEKAIETVNKRIK
jgi:C-terminal processing protease CtpA/Prc